MSCLWSTDGIVTVWPVPPLLQKRLPRKEPNWFQLWVSRPRLLLRLLLLLPCTALPHLVVLSELLPRAGPHLPAEIILLLLVWHMERASSPPSPPQAAHCLPSPPSLSEGQPMAP